MTGKACIECLTAATGLLYSTFCLATWLLKCHFRWTIGVVYLKSKQTTHGLYTIHSFLVFCKKFMYLSTENKIRSLVWEFWVHRSKGPWRPLSALARSNATFGDQLNRNTKSLHKQTPLLLVISRHDMSKLVLQRLNQWPMERFRHFGFAVS